MRFSLAHLLEWSAGTPEAGTPFTSVSMSSRPDGWPPMKPGGLFVAIRGARRDGHDYVADAFANGAVAALVDHVPHGMESSVAEGRVRVLRLERGAVTERAGEGEEDPLHPQSPLPLSLPHHENPLPLPLPRCDGRGETYAATLVIAEPGTGALATLQEVGGWWRRRWGRPVVAIAGSVGKTTTKDLVAAVLARAFRTLGTAGNLNNELGLPITLLGLGPEHEVAAVEIGISAPGEMATFAAIAAPDVAVMTRIEAEHLEFLRDIDTVAFEEGVLVACLPPSGTAVLNADDPRVLAMASRTSARILTYGMAPDADVRAEGVRSRGIDGVTFRLCHQGRTALVELPLAGRHFVSAALAAAAAGLAMGAGWDAVVAGLESTPVAPRIRVVRPNDSLLVIDDTYNASPASCIAALDLLAESPGTRVAILGDMFELGDYTHEAHATVGAHVARHADALVAVGDASRATVHHAIASGMASTDVAWVARAADAAGAFETWRRTACVSGRCTVLVKGSRGMRMELVTHDLERLAAPAERTPSPTPPPLRRERGEPPAQSPTHRAQIEWSNERS